MMKKPLEFSQAHVVFADGLVLLVLLLNALLSWFNKQPLSDLSVAIVNMYGAFATGGYFALNGVRQCSLNKYVFRKISKEDNDEN